MGGAIMMSKLSKGENGINDGGCFGGTLLYMYTVCIQGCEVVVNYTSRSDNFRISYTSQKL